LALKYDTFSFFYSNSRNNVPVDSTTELATKGINRHGQGW